MTGGAAYRHTQSGLWLTWLVVSFAVALGVAVVPWVSRPPAPGPAWVLLAAGLAVLLASAAIFSSLTVEVDADALRWHLAFGVWRKAMPRAEIARAEATRTTLLDGIGIHHGPRGWVYNVALGPAVRVVRRDGRAILLGTDDPDGLVAALTPLSS